MVLGEIWGSEKGRGREVLGGKRREGNLQNGCFFLYIFARFFSFNVYIFCFGHLIILEKIVFKILTLVNKVIK